ncbi:MAG TPA: alpha/beta hydrolase [Acidimicrobiales bacterium]|nr:alpha/beta hydrolase [Acidimicrobiales bacterium]
MTQTSPSLDPELAAVLAGFPSGVDPGGNLRDMKVITMLRSTLDLLGAMGTSLPTDERVVVADRAMPGVEPGTEIPLRIYAPVARLNGPAPALVFFHGGAFVLGDRYTEELRCLRYAAEAGCVVVSVDYRLAPEHRFPAGVEDCFAGLEWTVANAAELGIDPGRVGVGGSSAGGALAAAVALMARDRGGPALRVQILNYPVIDDRMQSASMRAFDATPMWTSGSNADMWQHYLGDPEDRGEVSVYAAPGRATDLRGLPPAYVLTAELDPLRDEGIEYATRLMEAGVPTELHTVPGACHGFDIIAATQTLGKRALEEQVRALVRGLGSATG